jgi:hypothetical protein
MAVTPQPQQQPRHRRRLVAACGLLVPGLAFAIVSAYVALGYGTGCNTGSTPAHTASCAGSNAGVAVVAFPAAVVCIVLGAAVLRGARWARWPAVGVSAVLATVTAAGSLAGGMALGGDGSDVTGALAVGLGGVAFAGICALPALLLTGDRGAQVFPPLAPS